MIESRWLLLKTKPRSEHAARRNLEAQRYRLYLPLIHRRSRRGTGDTLITEPLFAGYLFLKLVPQQSLMPASNTRGVSHFVRFGERFACVGQDLIDALRAREAASVEQAGAGLCPGALLTFTDGPFQSLRGIFESYDGTERAHVLIRWLGRQRRVTLPLASLEAS